MSSTPSNRGPRRAGGLVAGSLWALALLVACRGEAPCGSWEDVRLEVVGHVDEARLAAVRGVLDDAARWHGGDRICLDRVVLSEGTPLEDEVGASGTYQIPERTIRVDAGTVDLEGILLHELCHALDWSAGELSLQHEALLEEVELPSYLDAHLYAHPDSQRMERFALACVSDTVRLGWRSVLSETCEVDVREPTELERVIREEVWPMAGPWGVRGVRRELTEVPGVAEAYDAGGYVELPLEVDGEVTLVLVSDTAWGAPLHYVRWTPEAGELGVWELEGSAEITADGWGVRQLWRQDDAWLLNYQVFYEDLYVQEDGGWRHLSWDHAAVTHPYRVRPLSSDPQGTWFLRQSEVEGPEEGEYSVELTHLDLVDLDEAVTIVRSVELPSSTEVAWGDVFEAPDGELWLSGVRGDRVSTGSGSTPYEEVERRGEGVLHELGSGRTVSLELSGVRLRQLEWLGVGRQGSQFVSEHEVLVRYQGRDRHGDAYAFTVVVDLDSDGLWLLEDGCGAEASVHHLGMPGGWFVETNARWWEDGGELGSRYTALVGRVILDPE